MKRKFDHGVIWTVKVKTKSLITLSGMEDRKLTTLNIQYGSKKSMSINLKSERIWVFPKVPNYIIFFGYIIKNKYVLKHTHTI